MEGPAPTVAAPSKPPIMTVEGWRKYEEGLYYMLRTWTVLELAINFTGNDSEEKYEDIADDLIDVFNFRYKKNQAANYEEVEDVLLDALSECKTIVEDDSVTEIAYKCMDLWSQCIVNDYSGVDKLKQQYDFKFKSKKKSVAAVKSVEPMEVDEEEEEEEEEEEILEDETTEKN
eukprot:TRINITY_DN6356_c0_g1_i1.p1 TRINITY_DN6356_c0_g1~~TRINITY_DN6356_c0_g1_i1.p1  ORF type:complete len:174 (-),score=57.93 TRINITY_DN6356_c0_g1_i1:421-942(-)